MHPRIIREWNSIQLKSCESTTLESFESSFAAIKLQDLITKADINV